MEKWLIPRLEQVKYELSLELLVVPERSVGRMMGTRQKDTEASLKGLPLAKSEPI